MTQHKPDSNAQQVPCVDANSLTPTTGAPVYYDPCTVKSAEQTSKVALQNSHKVLNQGNVNGYMFFFRNPSTITTVQQEKTIAVPQISDPCVDESAETQASAVNIQNSKATFTLDDINYMRRVLDKILGSIRNPPTEKPKPTTAAPEIPVPFEDETHKTQETSEVTSVKVDVNKVIDKLIACIYQKSNEQQKSATNKNTETNVVKTTTTTIAAAPTTKTTQSNEVTAVTTNLSGILKNSQPTKSFKIKPDTTTTHTTTSNQYIPTKVIEGAQKETATSHVQNSADCDETKTASGGATSVDVTSTYAFPTLETKATESHDEKTVKSVPASVSTSTWVQYPVVSPGVPHIINWHKEQQSGSTYQKNSETHNLIFGTGAQQAQLTASQTSYPAINFEFSGQGNGVDQAISNGVNTHQLINLSDGSNIPIATLLESLKKQRDC